MDRKKTGAIILRCVIIAIAVSLAAFWCMSLKYENMRTSGNTLLEGTTADVGDDDSFVQVLRIDEGEQNLYGVALLFSENVVNPEGTVNVSVVKDGSVIEQWHRKGQFIKTTECEYFRFRYPQSCADHSFEVRVGFEGFGEGKPFAFRLGNPDNAALSYINGESTGSTIYYLNIYDAVPTWQMIMIPLLVFMTFLGWQAFYYCFIRRRLKSAAEGDFASVYIALLLLYFLFVPLNTVSDEGNHFLRSYSIAHGKFISDVMPDSALGGDTLPDGVVTFAERYDLNGLHNGKRQNDEPLRSLHADWDNTKEVAFANTAINVPYMYFPQALGIRLAEFVTDSPYSMAYCGRFFNMIMTAFMVLFAIRFTPSGKEFFKFTALLPMMMQETVSLAPDGFIVALIMVYIAVIMRLRFKATKGLELRHYLAAFILTIAVVMCKMVYAPICLLLFLVPSSKFGRNSRYYLTIGVFALSIISVLMSWMLLIQRYNLRFHYSNNGMQIDYILSEPGKALSVFANYILDSGSYIADLFGGNVGYKNIPIPSVILFVFVITALVICYKKISGPKGKLDTGRVIPLIIVILVYFLIGLSEYLGWSKVGASSIEGLVGRYYLPIIPLMFFAATGVKADTEWPESSREKMSFAVILSNLFVLVSYWIYTVY
ncbi:MAG: DUF2142 domain-containing protein [Clostridiales bacterium]|nr:DUF2142 domain-containing protein [Clostridiales bacterium]